MSDETVENLIDSMWILCVGKDVAAVVGAGLNIVFTVLDSVDSPEIRAHFAASLREMADKIESHQNESVH